VILPVLLSSLIGALPAAFPSPSATPLARTWDQCEKSDALPYDRPIGLKMRVLDGPEFDLTKYRGKAVLLNIFATWCGPCNHEMPALVETADAYADRGLRVVSIDAWESDNDVRAFRKKYGVDFPIAMDERGSLIYAMEVNFRGSPHDIEFPVTLFIDPNGFLYCQRTGGMSARELRYRVEHFLAASAPSITASTPSPSPSPAP
jgi:thiol-disulfide isomerase/thioredoxin